MKQTKSRRILALLLSLVMLVSLLPLQAFSEAELTEQTETIMEQTMETDVSDETTESDDSAADEDEQTDENPVEEGDGDYEELHEESTPTDLDESESEEPDEPAEDAATEAEQQEEPDTEPVTEPDAAPDSADEAEAIPQPSEETEIPSEETQEEIPGEEADDELLIEPDDPLPQKPTNDVTEEPAEVPDEEPADEIAEQEALPETEPTEELPVDEETDVQMTVADCIAAYGHAYTTTLDNAMVYADSAMLDEQHIFTISQAGALLLATAYVPETDAVKVWFMASDGEILMGYVHADSLRHSSTTYKLKLNHGDLKATQGDTGHAEIDMITRVYAHILDEDRKVNAQKFESAFYANPDLREVRAPQEQQPKLDLENLLLQLQQSPELADTLANLLAQRAKTA